VVDQREEEPFREMINKKSVVKTRGRPSKNRGEEGNGKQSYKAPKALTLDLDSHFVSLPLGIRRRLIVLPAKHYHFILPLLPFVPS
jgi:hypothetical protein